MFLLLIRNYTSLVFTLRHQWTDVKDEGWLKAFPCCKVPYRDEDIQCSYQTAALWHCHTLSGNATLELA